MALRYPSLALAILPIMIAIMSCRKHRIEPPENPLAQRSKHSSLVVRLAGSSTDIREVNLDIRSVKIGYAGSGWMLLKSQPALFSFGSAASKMASILTDTTSVPAGRINRLEITLGLDHNMVGTDGHTTRLKLPNGEKNTVVIDLDMPVENNRTAEVMLDFDVSKSVVRNENGELRLKPVIGLSGSPDDPEVLLASD